MDINSDCVDDCATNCPPSASSWVLPTHSQGLGDILSQNPNCAARMSPEHRAECSHGKPDMKRSQGSSAPEPQSFPTVPTGSATGNVWNSGDGFQCYPRKRGGLCKTPICTSEKFLKWSSHDYLGFRGFITALPTLPDFCLLFLISFSSLLPPIAECLPSSQHVPHSKHIKVCF